MCKLHRLGKRTSVLRDNFGSEKDALLHNTTYTACTLISNPTIAQHKEPFHDKRSFSKLQGSYLLMTTNAYFTIFRMGTEEPSALLLGNQRRICSRPCKSQCTDSFEMGSSSCCPTQTFVSNVYVCNKAECNQKLSNLGSKRLDILVVETIFCVCETNGDDTSRTHKNYSFGLRVSLFIVHLNGSQRKAFSCRITQENSVRQHADPKYSFGVRIETVHEIRAGNSMHFQQN